MTDVGAARAALTLSRGRAADLFRRHCADAVRLAYLLTGDAHLAEDLAQDAFVRSFGRFQDLRRPQAFASYLRRTVVNLSRDHFPRLQRERAHSERERPLDAEDDVRLSRVEAREELLHALQSLPPRLLVGAGSAASGSISSDRPADYRFGIRFSRRSWTRRDRRVANCSLRTRPTA